MINCLLKIPRVKGVRHSPAEGKGMGGEREGEKGKGREEDAFDV